MKNLIIEVSNPIKSTISESKDGKKEYILSGVFTDCKNPTANGRLYPEDIMKRAVDAYYENHLSKNSVNSLCELEHSDENVINLERVVAKIISLEVYDGCVFGKAKILDNDKANILKDILDNGINLAVSSRGEGDCTPDGTVFEYDLITYDVVSDPACSAAVLKLMESKGFKNGMKPLEKESPKLEVVKPILSKEDLIRFIKSL